MRKFFVSFLLLGSFFIFGLSEINENSFSFASVPRKYLGIFTSEALAANSDIIINEIGAYPTSTHEWIEIWNKGSAPIDLTGWKFWENSTNHGLSVSTTDFIVAPNEYAVIVQDDKQFILDYPGFAGSIFDSSWSSLNESGEEIGLKDNTGNFIEKFTYVSATNFSLQRRDSSLADYTSANWAEHASGNTVGALNVFLSTSTTPTSSPSSSSTPISSFSSITINEFVSDPDSGNEWVELYNSSTSSLDLAGGYICDSRNTTSTCKTISGTIGPNGWLKIDLQTDSYLNNTGDSVILKNSNGDVADEIVYDAGSIPAKGQSLARSVDGAGDWQITTQITPGAGNIITAPVVAQSSSGSGGGGGSAYFELSPATSSKKSTTTKISASKEKFIGLKWKIKYNPRLRQYEENVFDASSTLDSRGGRIEYGWNFGDQIVSGASIKYAFATSGTHVVVVRATSTAGTVDEKKITIMVYPSTEVAGSGVIFSEILPRAGNSEDEYIQLKNISSLSVNLSNWKIVYKKDIFEIPTSTTLAVNDYLTFYQTITGFTLNNSGGELLLLNQDNILVDEMEYGKADEDIAYVFDGVKWSWDMPTISAKVAIAKTNTTTKKSSGRFFTGIADARGGQKGDWARVKGVVAVLPGVFGSQYFYLVNDNIGIQIYQSKKDFPPLEVGDLAQVYGAISEASGIKRINVKNKNDIDILAIGNVVNSVELNIDEIDDDLVGGLVKFQGEIAEIKSNFMYVDNDSGAVMVYFKQGANIDKRKFKVGENVRVIGILEQTKIGWQIWPRSSSDIESLGLSGKQTLSGSGDTESKYLTATAGGVTTLILGFLFRTRGVIFKRAAMLAIGFIKKKDQG